MEAPNVFAATPYAAPEHVRRIEHAKDLIQEIVERVQEGIGHKYKNKEKQGANRMSFSLHVLSVDAYRNSAFSRTL